MQVAFLDDSEEKQPRRAELGHLVAVGGVVVPENVVALYSSGLQDICRDLEVPEGTELKWSPRGDSWLKTAHGNAVRTELRERMLRLAIALDITSIVVVWDRGLVSWPVKDVQVEVLKWVYERIAMCLPPTEVAIVVADEPAGGPRDQRTGWTRPCSSPTTALSTSLPTGLSCRSSLRRPITCRTCSSPTLWWARPPRRWPATDMR